MKWLAILLLAACAHTKTPDVYVQLEQGMGLWNLPADYNFTMTLYADGNVKFEGIVNSRPARLWGKADPAKVAQLMQEAEAVPEWHCDDVTDQPYANVTVYRHGVTRTFYLDLGDDPCTSRSAEDVTMDLRTMSEQFTGAR